MKTIIVNSETNINSSDFLGSAMDEKKSCDKFTLSDFSEHVDRLHSISMFLDSGAYTDDIRPGLTEHLLNEIESLQGVLMHAKAFGFDS